MISALDICRKHFSRCWVCQIIRKHIKGGAVIERENIRTGIAFKVGSWKRNNKPLWTNCDMEREAGGKGRNEKEKYGPTDCKVRGQDRNCESAPRLKRL